MVAFVTTTRCHKSDYSTLYLCIDYYSIRSECTFKLLSGIRPLVWLSWLMVVGTEETHKEYYNELGN